LKSPKKEDKLLKAVNIKGVYESLKGPVYAVDGCSFALSKGDITGILGESGSGKSTFGKLLMGYEKPPLRLIEGHVTINGVNIYEMNLKERKREVWGSLVAMVPQYSMNALNPTRKIHALIKDIMKEKIASEISDEEIRSMSEARVKELGLSPDVLDMYPFELSGGMKQRVVIAVSTLLNPQVLIADEPTSALDVSTQRQLLILLYNLVKKDIVQGLLFISHDISTLRQICNYLFVMYAGKPVELAETEKIINDPLSPYTKLLLNSIVTIDPEIRKTKLSDIPGVPPDLLNPPKGCRFRERCPYATQRCKQKDPPFKEIEKGRFVACWLYPKEV